MAGQICKSVQNGFGLNCSCSAMCASHRLRRRLLEQLYARTADVVFQLKSDLDMNSLLERLRGNSDAFLTAAGLPETSLVAITAFSFTPGVEPIPPSSGGSVSALIEFTTAQLASLRRLAEAEPLNQAVAEAVAELLSPELPKDAQVTCTLMDEARSSVITANVTIAVDSELGKTQSVFAAFLAADAQGTRQLPTLVSAKAALPLTYAPGYVPIVYVNPSGSAVADVLNILPYVAVAAAVGVAVISLVVYRYRFIIRSWWKSQKLTFGGYSSGWTGGRFAAQFERQKSETSSTPDTATNVDDNEFDDYILRTMEQ